MLRLANNFKNCSIDAVLENYTKYQSVRWSRKPRWLPVAKTKKFRVPKRTETPIEETLELQRLNNNYHTEIKSLRRYLYYQHNFKFMASEDPEQQRIIFEEDFARCNEINNKWNEQVKALREERVQKGFEEELDFAKNRVEFELMKRERKQQRIEEIVRQEKELSKTFITRENIDEAIEAALNNLADYNYALTLEGEKVMGKETNITSSQDIVNQV